MQIEKVQLVQFRNYKDLDLEFSPGVNVFIGPNGQGKTNLLESLYLLTRGCSFRPGKTENLIMKSTDTKNLSNFLSMAKAQILKKQTTNELQCQLVGNKKSFFKNKKRTYINDLYKNFPCILFSPESLGAIKNGPEIRRGLIDDLLICHNPNDVRTITDFKKALLARNRLLLSFKKEQMSLNELLPIMASLDPSYLQRSAELTHKRITAIRDIQNDLVFAFQKILDQKNVDISVDYLISSQNAVDWSYAQVYDSLHYRAQQLANSERNSGSSLVGPHKHDIRFIVNGEEARYYCSQGQQRALILAFKMAQISYYHRSYGDFPLLLLDDVLSELDQQKRAKLIEYLNSLDAQIFITTTDLEMSFERQDIKVFEIQNGVVAQQKKGVVSV